MINNTSKKDIPNYVGRNVNRLIFLLILIYSFNNRAFTQETERVPSDTNTGPGLRYPIAEDNYPFSNSGSQSPLLLRPPSNVNQNIEYDPETGQYVFTEKVGELNYRPPASMSLDEYRRYEAEKSEAAYWREKALAESGAGPSFMKNLRLGNQSVDKVFGTDVINIVPKGSAELMFGYSYSTDENSNVSERSRRNGSFLFQPKIMVNVTGSIGDKMEIGINYNTEASFDFENKTKLEYSGKEDEIIKKIEAGDVNFSLPGSLITGSQSLFGLKTELQFGHMTVTTIVGNQKGESSTINVQGGAQLTEFEVNVDQYDVNRHFFLSHFFRDHYSEWLENLPNIESQLQIQQIEVWVINQQNDYTQGRDFVAFMDLGEGYNAEGEPNFFTDPELIHPSSRFDQPADNSLNDLFDIISGRLGDRKFTGVANAVVGAMGESFNSGSDYVAYESARPLNDREYTINTELGYISLNSPLRNSEVLAVAYTYTYRGKTYQVGDLSNQIAEGVLVLKLLKGSTSSPNNPMWDLMMKNVYSIGAYQLSPENFVMNIFYRNDKTGVPVNYISEPDTTTISSEVQKQPLLKVLNLDNMDTRNEANPDGVFDYVEGVTINSRNGRIYFPVLEPFGSDLYNKIIGENNDVVHRRTAEKYVFQELYDSTQTKAEQIAEKNKFFLKGQYQSSSSSEIQLNATMVPRGSVVVTAGGQKLTENVDFTVDYTLGRVKIINQGLLESGTPIRISLETNQLFDFQTKTLLGTHLDYKFSENFNVGATVMHLKEIPLTKKVNMGDEPISNTIWGLNTAYRTQSQILTTLIDKLPFLETKQPSSISFEGEFAQLIPGQVKDINGVAYIDDFESAQTKIEMKSPFNWYISSAPQKNNDFTSANMTGLASGYGRAKLSWYAIDHLFYNDNYGLNPGNEGVDIDLQSHYARPVLEKEIFPTRENAVPGNSYLSILNLAYYPNERGPYNYDPNLTENGKLTNPEQRWAGIMRDIISSDFETSNIEFIEFWVMDPYLENPNHNGGDMYLHLGEVSEDILRDNWKTFEGGLPTDPQNIVDVDTTVWGRVPERRAFLNTFTEDEGKEYQDAGLDGLVDADELTFFDSYLDNVPAAARNIIAADPSADDFMYFLDDEHDNLDHGIFDRYKNYSNLEGNAPPVNNQEEYIPSNSNTPDIEDINDDNTMNEMENYFQYRISLRPEDIDEVGENFIVDQIIASVEGFDTPARWIQFRIPLTEWEKRVGDIEDFRSIRFMRLLLSDFDSTVHLRFATLDLVRADWRRYNYDMSESGGEITEQVDDAVFEVGAVNYEENSERQPVNYILPPGIDRATDYNTQQLVQQNEQSLSLKVKGLEDGDARSVFKNVQLDFRQYSKIKMFIHAEALPGMEGTISDGDLCAFVRIGSDYQNNYYEIEVPLTLTPSGVYDEDEQRRSVWPLTNDIVLILDELIELKKERNRMIQNDPLNYSSQGIYTKLGNTDSSIYSTLKIKGNPNLANVRQIMIGIRNPGDASSFNRTNDGLPKSAEIWFNELRLAEFNNRGGWAANGRIQAQLADFGVVSMAGNKSTPGFGSIEEKVAERSMEETNQYDISSNLELGKFFPEKASVSIPLYVGASRTIINPEYYPKDPDIKLKDMLDEMENESQRDSIKRLSQDLTSRSSINITNMRWNKKIKKFDVISPANLTATLGYTQTRSRNYSTDYNNLWKYNASLNYVFNTRVKNIQPLKKSKSFKKPVYKIIKDFNFNPYPSRFSFGTTIDRNYQEVKLRNVYEDVELIIEPTVNKDFTWDRKYDLKWELTRGLKFDYSATNTARIDEPYGQQDLFKSDNEIWKEEVWNSMKGFGRNMSFNQKMDISYTLPINKIPIFNWVSVTSSYGTTFSWMAGQDVPGRVDIGNTIKNSNNLKFTGNFNLKSLYSKVGYLKKLETKYQPAKAKDKGKPVDESQIKTVEFEKKTFFKKDEPRNIVHKLNTEEIEVIVTDATGKTIQVNTAIVNSDKVAITASEDVTNATVKITGKIPKGQNPLIFIADNTLRLLTGFKSVNVSWNRAEGSVLPGFLPGTDLLGVSFNDYYGAPGWPFVFGIQDTGLVRNFIDREWITHSNTLSKPFEYNRRDEINLKASFEPFNRLRIDLNGLRTYSEYNEQIFFQDDSLGLANYHNDEYYVDRMYKGGSFSISIISILTAFEKQNTKNDFESAAFNRFKEIRPTISQRRYRALEDNGYARSNVPVYSATAEGYYDGYGPTSQDVLVPAFLAAYTGTNPKNINLNSFFWNIMPNWNITYDGLSDIPFVQKFVKSISVKHTYKSVYSIGGFSTNMNYFEAMHEEMIFNNSANDDNVRSLMRDNQDNIVMQYLFSSVSIREQLSPLIGFDMTWHNSLLTKFEFGKTRAITLSLNNNQINESRNTDYTIGAGYRFKEVPLNVRAGGSKKQIKSDLNVRFDASLRDNITIIRVINVDPSDEGISSVTTGAKKLNLGLTADYVFSDKFNVQFFVDREVNTPHTNLTFRMTETNVGFILKLTL